MLVAANGTRMADTQKSRLNCLLILMLEYKTGNILAENVEALVNTVNCVGVMGRGVALMFKKAFPDNFEAYAHACRRKEVRPGQMFVVEQDRLVGPRYIVNFPTKRHWRGKSRMEDIESGLLDLRRVIREKGIRSIAIPPLGSGLGGLAWSDVRPQIEEALHDLDDVRVVIFEPNDSAARHRTKGQSIVPSMTPGRSALVALMQRYLDGLLDPFVTPLEVHKLMYFMKATGEGSLDTLHMVKGQYGPQVRNLNRVLGKIEGHFISGFTGVGDTVNNRLELVPGANGDAEEFLNGHPAVRSNVNRVANLMEGFETPAGLSLLSTTHWVIDREKPSSFDGLITAIRAWDRLDQQFSPSQIQLAADVLEKKGWVRQGILRDTLKPCPEECSQ